MRRIELATATAAALAAYALAFLPAEGRGLRAAAVALAVAIAFGARAVTWSRAPAGLVRWSRTGLNLLLVAIGALVVFARQFPLVRYAEARRTGAVLGGALALLALAFLAGRRIWPSARHLLPAIAGVLVAAGMERGGTWFVPLACVAAAGLWIDAFRTGGPRRPGAPIVAAGLAGASLSAAIAWFLPVAQPRVQELVARAFIGGRTGLSDRSDLGDVSSLAQSHRIVARVWTKHPQLLRMQVFSRFDGNHWLAFPRDGRPMRRVDHPRLGLLRAVPGRAFTGADTQADFAGLLETRVLPELWMDDGWGVLAPSGPLLVVWPQEGLALDDRGLVTTGGASARLYGVASRQDEGTSVPPIAADLQPPLRLDPRVRALAESLRHGDPPGPELIARTVGHLRTHYRYTLDMGAFETRDPLAEFLFDKRAGYCEYFATAAVVLLRLQGVPARYVKGVSVRPDRLVGDHYVVRESDAHAWVDAWTAGGGWSEVDPTPANGWALTHEDERPGVLAALWERIATFGSQAWAGWRQGTWPWLADGLSSATAWLLALAARHRWAFAAVLAGIAIPLVLARRRPRVREAAMAPVALPPDLAGALRRVERIWARAGQPRPASRGLLEHLEDLPPTALSAAARDVSRRVVAVVYESAFAGRPPAPAELDALAAAVRALPR